VRDRLNISQFDQLIGQQLEGPAFPAFRRRTASERHQMRLADAIHQMLIIALRRLTMQSRRQTLFDKTLAHARHGGRSDVQRRANLTILPSWTVDALVGFQQDPGMRQRTRRCLARRNEIVQQGALFGSERYVVLLVRRLL
jgi:hypothetical protein